MNKLLTGAVLAGLMLVVAPASNAADPPKLLPAVVTVHMKDFKYDPTPAKIHAGDRVTFVNDDAEPHTVTAEIPTRNLRGRTETLAKLYL